MSWLQSQNTIIATPIRLNGPGPIMQCVNGSLNMQLEFRASFDANDTRTEKMTDSELANYVLADPPMITALVKAWLSTDSSFRTFVQRNANKIRSKFRKASEVEDCHDVLAELEFARAILTDARFEIEYEPDIRS